MNENNGKKSKGKFVIILIPLVSFLLFGLSGLCIWLYDTSYENLVYPGVRIGGYNIGGMSRLELNDLIENLNNRYAKEGIDLSLAKDSGLTQVKLNTVALGDSAVEMVRLDSEALSQSALMIGRTGDKWQQFFSPVDYRFNPVDLSVPVVVNNAVLTDNLKSLLASYEDKVQDASIRNINPDGESAEIVPEKSGQVFDYAEAVERIKTNLAKLSFEPVVLQPKSFSPAIRTEDIRAAIPSLWPMLRSGPPLELVANLSPSSSPRWTLTSSELADFIEVSRDVDGKISFFLNQDKVEEFLKQKITPSVEVPARDAHFTTENNKVKDFEPSAVGLTVDLEATYNNLNTDFIERSSGAASGMVEVVLKQILPRVQLSSSNDLGIAELVGAGTTTFKDSHTRRIKNIANAVNRLNGTLIKPGEIFSAIKYAGPFTAENGYLPEQIIKGRKIQEEVGGGMCQIGTTLFRMAMQTGLPITERHNHSLVIQYYADPVNGNPGTDATLYEPTLDLKFLNDTGHYLLLLTNINFKKQMLTFSLWGTKDGRIGWYTHPNVTKWIPAPAAVEYVPLDNTAAAADGNTLTKCQSAFRGAVANFTYSRITPTGERIDRVFDSYYRPLPKICPATSTLASQ